MFYDVFYVVLVIVLDVLLFMGDLWFVVVLGFLCEIKFVW